MPHMRLRCLGRHVGGSARDHGYARLLYLLMLNREAGLSTPATTSLGVCRCQYFGVYQSKLMWFISSKLTYNALAFCGQLTAEQV